MRNAPANFDWCYGPHGPQRAALAYLLWRGRRYLRRRGKPYAGHQAVGAYAMRVSYCNNTLRSCPAWCTAYNISSQPRFCP